jgi:hypothetical protein
MDVELTIVKELAAVPPNVTDDDPVKSVPVMVMVSPVEAMTGVKELIVGDPEILIVAYVELSTQVPLVMTALI